MLFIHQIACISPQYTFFQDEVFTDTIDELNQPKENILYAIEPAYDGIPPGILRRMGRAVRLGIGAAIPLIHNKSNTPDGIIIGTSMGGMEDCVKFLIQIIEYNEGTLTPTNFVQSTPNAIAGQLGLMTKNRGYNITHVHRGFSFENAWLDAAMMIKENPDHVYLTGAVDEISLYNHNIERLDGWYKELPCTGAELYNTDSTGTIAGEGSAMFMVSGQRQNATACLTGLHFFHTRENSVLVDELKSFLEKHCAGDKQPDLLLSGENGDNRFLHFYKTCENITGAHVPVARFKHLSGDHPTAVAFACWLACNLLQKKDMPIHMKKKGEPGNIQRILIYNNYKGLQHSFILLEKA